MPLSTYPADLPTPPEKSFCTHTNVYARSVLLHISANSDFLKLVIVAVSVRTVFATHNQWRLLFEASDAPCISIIS